MGANKFFVFKEDGTLARLKSSISRFLDNDPPVNDDKVNIRASISVPASAEGLTPANNLSDVSSAATSRTNLGVNGIDADAEATGTKLVGPALYFTTNDWIEFADDGKWSFTNGTDDLPFSVSAWIKVEDATNFPIISKYNVNAEWRFQLDGNDKLQFLLRDNSAAVSTTRTSSAALTSYEGQWIHVAATYGGSGPNSATAFSDALDGGNAVLYVNGVVVASAASNTSYAGMKDTTQPVWVGRHTSSYAKGSIREVRICNRKLSATEVVAAMNGDLGFSDEWGDHTANIVTDGDMEAAGTSSWIAYTTTLSKETASPHGGTQNLKVILNGSTSGYVQTAATPMSAGKRYRATFWYRTGGTAPNSYLLRGNGSTWQDISTLAANASWTYHSVEFVANSNTNGRLVFYISLGTDSNTYIEVDDFEVVEIGVLADLRAEDYNSSSGKWLDRSTNNFVGVNNGATYTGKRRHLSAATLNLTNLPTSSAGLSAGEVWSNSGVLTIV